MEYDWDDLSDLLMEACCNFTSVMLKTTEMSPNIKSKEMITTECMERFGSITGIVKKIIKNGKYYNFEDLEKKQKALKLNGWILLGSLTETALQVFLAFYINDYKNSKWQLWKDFDIKKFELQLLNVFKV